jgi:3-hydroxybutyryl-CoA dehydratase
MKKGDTFNQRFAVSENIYQGFIRLFNDRNPLHCDESFALQKGFKSVAMHGNILCGFISCFVGECLPLKNVMLLSQEIKYSNPVYLNEILEFHAEVSDVFDSVNVVELKFSFKKDGTVKVAQGKIQIRII